MNFVTFDLYTVVLPTLSGLPSSHVFKVLMIIQTFCTRLQRLAVAIPANVPAAEPWNNSTYTAPNVSPLTENMIYVRAHARGHAQPRLTKKLFVSTYFNCMPSLIDMVGHFVDV